jgi:hypothetical protein
MIRMLLMLCFFAGPLIAAPADRYETDWADRAAEAQTPDQRAALAEQLLAAAKQTEDKPYAVHLCFKAYEFGSRQITGYDTAAKALDLAQRLDPSRRVDCLDRLRFLYDSAYERSPHKLKLGVGLADVLGELAETRVDQATAGFDVGRRSPVTVVKQLTIAVAEVERSVETLNKVLTRASEDRLRAIQLGRDNLADALKRFAKDHRPMLVEATERQQRLAAVQQRFHDLVALTGRFRNDPTPKNAQSVAAMYLIEFDQPHRISPQVIATLPGSMAGPAKLAAAKVDSLDADEALMLCRWYRDLARMAQTDQARQDMLIRARLYADRVAALNDDRAKPHLKPIDDAMAEADLPAEEVAGRVAALRARLAAVGHGQAIAAADLIADPTDAGFDSQPADEDQPMLTDASNNNVGGRPMVVCDKCGRQFFPGWGVKATTCERCKTGHRNIFDFGN